MTVSRRPGLVSVERARSSPVSGATLQFMSRINRILFVAVVSVLSVLGCCVAAAPAQAVDRIARVSLPVRAGTHLIFSDSQGPARSADYDCTAGAVLTGSGILSRITPYQRAVRYVVTAKHCGGRGAHVRVGDVQVGSVIWDRQTPTSRLSGSSPCRRPEEVVTRRRPAYAVLSSMTTSLGLAVRSSAQGTDQARSHPCR